MTVILSGAGPSGPRSRRTRGCSWFTKRTLPGKNRIRFRRTRARRAGFEPACRRVSSLGSPKYPYPAPPADPLGCPIYRTASSCD